MITTHSNKLALSKYWNLFNECANFSTFQKCLIFSIHIEMFQ